MGYVIEEQRRRRQKSINLFKLFIVRSLVTDFGEGGVDGGRREWGLSLDRKSDNQ